MNQTTEINASPKRPYLIRALHEWIEDNHLTPYLHVDATISGVMVPMEHVKEGQIVLNLSSTATHKLIIANDAVHFSARFGGVSRNLYIPMTAVMGVYAKENGEGLFFDPEEYANYSVEEIESFSEDEITDTKALEDAKKEADKTARLEKAKKSGFRVIE